MRSVFSACAPSRVALGFAAWTPPDESAVRVGGADLTVLRSFVTHDYFSVLGVAAARGRVFGADEARLEVPARVVVVSHAFWENALGGDPGALGRTIEHAGDACTIVGITAEGFAGVELTRTDLFLPLSAFNAGSTPFYESDGNYFRALVRWRTPPPDCLPLRPGSTLSRVGPEPSVVPMASHRRSGCRSTTTAELP